MSTTTHNQSELEFIGELAVRTAKKHYAVTLSIHGSPRTYAATWTKATTAVRNVWTTLGDRQEILDATPDHRVEALAVHGSGAKAVLVMSLVDDGVPAQVTFDQTRKAFLAECATAQANADIPTCIAVHGKLGAERYSTIWQSNTEGAIWAVDFAINPAYWKTRHEVAEQAGFRPRQVLWQVDGIGLVTLYSNDSVGAWDAVHNLDALSFGMILPALTGGANTTDAISVDGAGSGSSARFNAVFAKRRTPRPRVFRKSGTGTAATQPFDDWARISMEIENARAASIAVTWQGRLVHARGYAWAADDFPLPTPTTRFRVMSVSKVITATMIAALVNDGQIGSFNDPVSTYMKLPKAPPGRSHDPGAAGITIRGILNHETGWGPGTDMAIRRDEVVAEEWAKAGKKPIYPVTLDQILGSWLASPPATAPGPGPNYISTGYALLGRLIETLTGKPYATAVQDRLFAPLGITGARLARPTLDDQHPDEPLYDPQQFELAPSVVLKKRPWAPTPYGGSWNADHLGAYGGWVMSMPEVACFMATANNITPFASPAQSRVGDLIRRCWIGGRGTAAGTPLRGGWWQLVGTGSSAVRSHTGQYDGTASLAFTRPDGLCLAVAFNRRGDTFAGSELTDLLALANAIPAASWPTTDRFPSFGLTP